MNWMSWMQRHRPNRRSVVDCIGSLVLLIMLLGVCACSQRKNDPAWQLQEAKRYLKAEDFRMSMASINKAITLAKDRDDVYTFRGELHARQGLLSMAIDDYTHALTINPGAIEALHQRGGIYRRLGRYSLAEADFSAILAIDATNLRGYLERGKVLLKQKRYEESVQDFQFVLSRDANHAEAHCAMGQVYEAKGDVAKAMHLYHRALERDSGFVEAHILLGALHARQNKMSEGITAFDNALRVEPLRGDVYYKRSFLFYATGDYQQALDDIIKAKLLGESVDAGYIARLQDHVQATKAK